MVVTLLVKSLSVFKHLMAWFKITDIGCKWHEAHMVTDHSICFIHFSETQL